jgi:hypothetical protein
MKNKEPQTWQEYSNNVVDTCNFEIMMHIVVPSSAGIIQIPSTAAFQYKLDVQFIDYEAIWGMFEPSKDMSGEAVEAIATYWGPWNTLQDLRLPFAEPSVDMLVTTQVAGAMILEGNYLYTENEQGEKAYATFDGKSYKDFYLEGLSLDSEIGASTTMHVLFDKDPERGHIDQLFAIRPDKIGYKYSVKFNEQETPQVRITNNTSIKLDAVCNLPMIFNQGVELAYADTIQGIDLSMLNLDSLLNEVEVLDTLEKANAKLVVKIENSIPLQFKGVLTCLDENNNVIINLYGKLFRLNIQNRLHFNRFNGFKSVIPYGVILLTVVFCNIKSVARFFVKLYSFFLSHIHSEKNIRNFIAVADRGIVCVSGEFVNAVTCKPSC